MTTLPGVIRTLYAERKSGILHFSCPPSPRRIFFRQGRIVRVESDAESERFGEELVKTGSIPRAELNSALELAIREGTSAGSALVKMKRLTAEKLKEVELQRMSAMVHSLLASTAGEFHFEESEDPVAEGEAFEIPAEQVILDGVRRIADASQLRSLVGDLGALLRTTPSSPLPLFKIKMTPAERGLLEATRERRPFSTEQLLSSSRLSEIEALRAVYALISIGLLELEGTPQPRLDAIEKSETAVEVASEPAPRPEAPGQAEPIPQRLGRFDIQKLLVRSSTGQVFRGKDPEIERIVVIKVLDSVDVLTAAAREKYLKGFFQEIERARQLYHPGIVAVLETGLTEEGRPFLVTEHVQGTTLRDLLPSGPLAMKHSLQLAIQVIDALAYAHSRGIVHRRVKPSNVLVTADGRAKIKDFGLPRSADAEPSASLPYLSPEQIATGTSDARADVFSFGVVWYRMLTGALPFPERSFTTAARAQPAPLETYNSELPPRLGKIVLRCLAGDPLQRFADAGELKEALSSLGSREGRKPADQDVAPAPGPAPLVTTAAPTPPPPPPARATAGPSASHPPAEARTPPPSPPPARRAPSLPATPVEVPVVDATPAAEPVAASIPTRGVATAEVTEAPLAANPSRAKPSRRREPSRRSPGAASASERARRAAPQRQIRGWILPFAVALSLVAVTLAVGGAWTLIAREEPWKELPSAPTGDVTVTPVPVSPPSEAVLEALLAGPSDEALFADAKSVLERGDLDASRRILMELLERTPDFPGAQALLKRVEAERRKAAERARREVALKREPQPVASDPSDADLFSEAEVAFARGELAVSKTKLKALLEINPSFPGAAEMMERLEYKIWITTLPRSFAARHNHRIGGCDGTLSLTQTGLSFRSDDHEWAWGFDELVSMDRPDPSSFNIVTSDRDLLGILSNKRLKFRLEEAFRDDDWRFFRKMVEDRE